MAVAAVYDPSALQAAISNRALSCSKTMDPDAGQRRMDQPATSSQLFKPTSYPANRVQVDVPLPIGMPPTEAPPFNNERKRENLSLVAWSKKLCYALSQELCLWKALVSNFPGIIQPSLPTRHYYTTYYLC
ncbi:hypothetical protein KQX54_020955 [Cotesia glomerata]|uniref:Uncharacterized protein n=1 Tax=Cotesia glomerata TaxID=32391 RepID=A0AAV7I787_COTGL|nr:hypothetical protein KQX54_020955 [Cotesia glomerata]